MLFLSRSQFLDLKPQTEKVILPGDFTVTTRELSSAEVTEFYKRQRDSESKAIAYLLLIGVLNAEGESNSPLFNESDSEALANRPHSLTAPLINSILVMSGLRDAPEKK